MSGHLAFYREHGISPVYYTGSATDHFQRRASLYRSLRLPPLAFRGANVLEVAAGSGQNAEYLQSLRPARLELIEPNPLGWDSPNLRRTTLEDYDSPFQFDIVICENWLGLPEVGAGLLDKLAALVALDGVLVLTCIHPQGIYPNMLRRKIAARLVNDSMSFESKTQILVSAFETHLATMPDMTRTARDWVQDMMLNPAVEGIGLTFPMLIDKLGKDFTILGTSPEFITDWRWFKSLHGEARRFNEFALRDYTLLSDFFRSCNDDPSAPDGLEEAEAMLKRDVISIGDIRAMGPFRSLFGRETIHLSMERNS